MTSETELTVKTPENMLLRTSTSPIFISKRNTSNKELDRSYRAVTLLNVTYATLENLIKSDKCNSMKFEVYWLFCENSLSWSRSKKYTSCTNLSKVKISTNSPQI